MPGAEVEVCSVCPGRTEKGTQRYRVTGVPQASSWMWGCLNWVLKENKALTKVKNERVAERSGERTLCTKPQRLETKGSQ